MHHKTSNGNRLNEGIKPRNKYVLFLHQDSPSLFFKRTITHAVKLAIHVKNQARNIPLWAIVRPTLEVSEIKHKQIISKINGRIKKINRLFFKFSKVTKIKITLKNIIGQITPSSSPAFIKFLL